MKNELPTRIKTISEFHKYRDLPQPEHPMISIVDYKDIQHRGDGKVDSFILDFYSISLKRTTNAMLKYGQQPYDFDSGVLFFISPNQLFSVRHSGEAEAQHTGWLLLVHPDFFWNSNLITTIKQYDFFDYAVNEALFLSEKEETILMDLIQNIRREYSSNLDKFSQNIIISQIETLLNYSERFYQRQFITRKISNHEILSRMENLLKTYIDKNIAGKGIPTVQWLSDSLHISPGYLSSLLKSLTGSTTQQHIHNKLIEKAKERLSGTRLTVSEIAYELGFEHPQGFSKLFKNKTNLTPLEFRNSLNQN